MPKAPPSAYGCIPEESSALRGATQVAAENHQTLAKMTREEALRTSNRIIRELFTPTIKVYGEAIVELGGKKYLVNAPEGVTIRERNDLDN